MPWQTSRMRKLFVISDFCQNAFLVAKQLYEALMLVCLSFCLYPFSENFQKLQKALMSELFIPKEQIEPKGS
jgi:hypothetical protein